MRFIQPKSFLTAYRSLGSTSIVILFALCLFIDTSLRLVVVITNFLDLAPDEAHYWEWSKQLDWSYYSKGPLVAILIHFGTSLCGNSELGVRLPAVLIMAIWSVLLFRELKYLAGPQFALIGWLGIKSTPLFTSMSLAMTTDPPLALFWLMALMSGRRAFESNNNRWWLLACACIGLGFLGKYTVILLGLGIALAFWQSPSHRKNLFSPSFLLGGVVFAVLISPIVYWNYQHGWVNLQHNSNHLRSGEGLHLAPWYFFDLLGAQLGLLTPGLFALGLYALFSAYKNRTADRTQASNFFLYSCLPLLFVCILVSLTRRVYANWPMPIYINLLLLTGSLFKDSGFRSRLKGKFVTYSIALSLAATAVLHLPLYNVTLGLPVKVLATKKLAGWQELGQLVRNVVTASQKSNQPVAAVLTTRYDIASSIAFYADMPGKMLVANIGGRRMNQYDVWGGWENYKGQNILIVTRETTLPIELLPHFRSVESIEPNPYYSVIYGGHPVRSFSLWIGHDFDGLPTQEPIDR